MWNVIHLHTVGHIPHSAARPLEFVSDECYFMATLNQTLSKLVSVRFDASKFREGEICANEYAIFWVGMTEFGRSVKVRMCLALSRCHGSFGQVRITFGPC